MYSNLNTVRGFSSPTSICSTYKESASGCFSTDTIFPTRKSNRVISIAVLAAGFSRAILNSLFQNNLCSYFYNLL